MSEQRAIETSAGSTDDRKTETGEIVEGNQRNVTLANIDTGSMATDLHGLFDRVMSGKPYDEKQVKNATNLTNTIVKVLRFEFDVYKHFVRTSPGRSIEGNERVTTVAGVAEWLRNQGDEVKKGAGPGLWVINDRPCEETDLIKRANNTRRKLGAPLFEIE